jgi:amidophosphoribosyltransferase
MSPTKMIAARDPHGMHPLCIGTIGENSYVIASETVALDAIGAKFLRDVEPGEVILINKDGLKSFPPERSCKDGLCIFEHVYTARPDSVIDGASVHRSRLNAGKFLAQEHPVEADVVIGAPDSGLDAAIGYATESKIPYGIGLIKNRYIGRTFIQTTQSQRERSVQIKLNPLGNELEGKRVVLVDDSIVRGTTCADIVKLLKNAGAKEVHVRISSPTLHYPCLYGTDIPTREELTSNRHSVEELCEIIGADSLGFLNRETLGELIGACEKTYCDACFTGDYPIK